MIEVSGGIQPAAVDLFSGCGGLTLGLRNAGFRVVAAVEMDSRAIKTYQANHTEVAMWQGDIRDLQPDELLQQLEPKDRRVDLLAGCPPCQGFSRIRTLNGSRPIADPRNDLLLDFQRFVIGLKPRCVMMENVPGVAGDRRFREFCEVLKGIGYIGDHRILDVAKYGVPQRRSRLIYLAGYNAIVPFGEEAAHRPTVRDVLYGLAKAGDSGDHPHDRPERRSARIAKLIQAIPKDGGSRTDLPPSLHLDCHNRCAGFSDVYGRMAWDRVAPTITSGCYNPSKGRFLHPDEDRAITIREAALLQGFPQTYKFPREIGKESLAEMIGNALPPLFVEAHSRGAYEVLRDPKSCSPKQEELTSPADSPT